jgi:hypothetical protein
MPYIFTTTTATYTLAVTQVNTVNHGTWTDVVSHVHWKLIADDNGGNRVSSNGTVPFQLSDITHVDKQTGQQTHYPGVFAADSFVPYEQLTEEMVLPWAQNDPIFADVVDALAERLKMINNVPRTMVPWNTSTVIAAR